MPTNDELIYETYPFPLYALHSALTLTTQTTFIQLYILTVVT